MTATRPGARLFAWLGALLFACSLAVFFHAYFVAFGRPAPAGSTALPAVLANVALFTGFALHHSLLARSGARERIARAVSPAMERPLYVWVASLLFIAVCGAWRPVPGDAYRLTGAAAAAGYLVQLIGILLTIAGSSSLGVADLAGLRPPHPEPGGAPTLRTSGLYGFVRHPLYFAWMLVVFGAPHMTMTRLVFAIVSTAYVALAIPFEERGLVRTFGDEYRRYQRAVRWRMLPPVY